MRFVSSSLIRWCGILMLASPVACGGGSGDDGPDAGMGGAPDAGSAADGGGIDAAEANNGVCEEGGYSTDNRYLPLKVGNVWRYEVTDGFDVTIKRQEYTEVLTPSAETGEVVVQITEKIDGITENWLQQRGDVVVRLRQRDFDAQGNLERTTCYLPYRTRFDETAERLIKGATWTDDYIRYVVPNVDNSDVSCDMSQIVCDPNGVTSKCETVKDQWTVTEDQVECETSFGTMPCIEILRVRLEGGDAPPKQYRFARGFGKVLEQGDLREELIGCQLQ
ncbi:hypothetical protein [Haliangium sp.]|uniref:hypothetical protein n=1 Tax=Haliangium sp. TaxID=2663208 RepID=UPI003D0DB6E4